MIKTKGVYEPVSKGDGVRVLVTRYWPRGVKKEKTDCWMRDLAPSPALIKKWKSGAVVWGVFEREYRAEYREDARRAAFAELADLIRGGRGAVTLLCTCKEEDPCHRKILKRMLEKGG